MHQLGVSRKKGRNTKDAGLEKEHVVTVWVEMYTSILFSLSSGIFIDGFFLYQRLILEYFFSRLF